MKPLIIFVASCALALVFEWVCGACSRKFGPPLSKSQWCCFTWITATLLCALTLMAPHDAQSFMQWSPMVLTAIFHIQLNQQKDIVERQKISK